MFKPNNLNLQICPAVPSQFLNRAALCSLLVVLAGMTSVRVEAASQTWTNAPVDDKWNNTNNWVARAIPGVLNSTGNSVNNDIATFNTPLAGGIGGASLPVLIDDATTLNTRSRQIGGITFDTDQCGAYVFSSLSPELLPTASNPETGILNVSHNGSIRINAAVANSQEIRLPLRVRLPSSTAGRYNFINNSVNPATTLSIFSAIHDGATTRATLFVLDGINTGNNIVTNLSEGVGNATGGITKQGAGTWIIAGAGLFPAASPINVNEGILAVMDPAVFGAATTAAVNSNGVLRIDGITLNQNTLTVRQSGTVRMNGSGTLNGVTVDTAAGTAPTLATTSLADVMTVGNTVNKLTGGVAGTILHVAGPGVVSLAFDNSYAGKWSVDSGTLQLAAGTATPLGTGPSLNISAGATLDLSPLGATTFVPSTTGIGGSGTGTTVGSTAATVKADPGGIIDLATGTKAIALTFSPTSFTGDTAHPALYVSQGTLSLAGNAFSIHNASGTPLGAGTYLLIQQASGNITDGGGYSVVGVTGGGVVPGGVASITVSGGNVNLVVSSYTSKSLVWTGGNPDNIWTLNDPNNLNWLDGAIRSVFNNSDAVTFNSVGSTNPLVSLLGTLAPGSVTVDSSVNDYTFAGSGQIAGSAGLLKTGSGTLLIERPNTYSGGTVVSNGTLRVGIDNALPSTGAGNVAIYGTGVVDLNNFSDAINALVGNGSVDVQGGGASTLSIGNNDNSGTFSGVLKNTSGTLALTKNGNGVETLSGANTYSGATTLNAGTLIVGNYNALGSGGSAVTINGGTLDLMTDAVVGILGGGAGTIANDSTSTTNTLVVTNTSTFGGVIANGSGGGGVKVLVASGTLRLNAANSYSGGTFIAEGAGLAFGGGAANAGAGGIIASNNTTIRQANTGSGSSGPGNAITTVDGATVTLSSGTTANNWGGQFFGSASATNIFTDGNMTIGGANSFSNFFGTAIFTNGGARMFNANGGGENTTFVFTNGGGMFSRDANTIRLGALSGNGTIGNPSVSGPATYWIGAKGIDSVYSGTIAGSNNIVKTGVGKLTFNGVTSIDVPYSNNDQTFTTNIFDNGDGTFTTNIVDNGDQTYSTNHLYSPSLTYSGFTTISNGVLAVVVPNNLGNSPTITLASSTAVLDATKMGYVTNFLDESLSPTNSLLVTNGLFELMAGQTLAGLGTIQGSLRANSGSTINVGLPVGILTIGNTATLNGAINMDVNNTSSPNSDRLVANSFSIDPGATLTVVNNGPAFQGGEVFQLFNTPVNFASVALPPIDSPLSWTNKLAIDGTIAVLGSLVNTVATNMTFTVSGNALTLNWPSDRIGWRLQMQTNAPGAGIGTNWFDVSGSSATNQIIFPLDSGSAFFRMVYP